MAFDIYHIRICICICFQFLFSACPLSGVRVSLSLSLSVVHVLCAICVRVPVRVPGSCELPGAGAGNRTWVPRKNDKLSYSLSHLSSLFFLSDTLAQQES